MDTSLLKVGQAYACTIKTMPTRLTYLGEIGCGHAFKGDGWNYTLTNDEVIHHVCPIIEATNEQKAQDSQVGGDHYKSCAIQPIEYIHKNGLGYCEANILKYITRHKQKNGKQDLLKAKHYIDLLIELEYGDAG